MPGRGSSLSVDLHVTSLSYLGNGLSQSDGFKIGIGEASLPAIMTEQGFTVGLGRETNVAVSRSLISRLPTPYPSQCVRGWSEIVFTGMANSLLARIKNAVESAELKYSQLVCNRLCQFGTSKVPRDSMAKTKSAASDRCFFSDRVWMLQR